MYWLCVRRILNLHTDGEEGQHFHLFGGFFFLIQTIGKRNQPDYQGITKAIVSGFQLHFQCCHFQHEMILLTLLDSAVSGMWNPCSFYPIWWQQKHPMLVSVYSIFENNL